jgi:two-component system cell cycle response regulator DivK
MSNVTVLVVEDNDKNLKLIRDVLQFAGFNVVTADTAEIGVRLAIEDPPAIVLMDLQLPGMDGTQALGELRASPRTTHIPVVAVTAYAMDEDRERVLRAGFDGYITKPLNIRALPAQIRDYLPPEGNLS